MTGLENGVTSVLSRKYILYIHAIFAISLTMKGQNIGSSTKKKNPCRYATNLNMANCQAYLQIHIPHSDLGRIHKEKSEPNWGHLLKSGSAVINSHTKKEKKYRKSKCTNISLTKLTLFFFSFFPLPMLMDFYG